MDAVFFGKNKFIGPLTIHLYGPRYGGHAGRIINVLDLLPNSNVKIIVECKHGQRSVKWCRRYSLCKSCLNESLEYRDKLKQIMRGRKITWGHKISKAKKGISFSDDHRKKLSIAHKGVPLSQTHKDALKINRRRGENHPNWKNLSYCHRLIRKRLSNAIHMKLHSRSLQKTQSINSSLSYTIQDLIVHLERQFLPGMSWENYGRKHNGAGWEIDHIIPDSWFVYNSDNDENFKKCWALENLQPKWRIENCCKGNRYIG